MKRWKFDCDGIRDVRAGFKTDEEVSVSGLNLAMFCNVSDLKESSVSLCVALMASAHLHQIKRHYLVIPSRD